MARILIVEDEANIRSFIKANLETSDYQVLCAETCALGMMMYASHRPDLIVLDLGLPDMDGSEIIRSVRSWSRMPIIIISARSAEIDKASALDMGADDYLTKPFGTVELLARIRTAIRHTRTPLDNNEIAQSGKFTVKDLTIDYDKHHVLIGDQDVHLTLNEFKIVALLGRHAGQVLTLSLIHI